VGLSFCKLFPLTTNDLTIIFALSFKNGFYFKSSAYICRELKHRAMTAKERANKQRKEYKEMSDIRSRIDGGGSTTYTERQRLYIWEKRKAKKSKTA
jgi:hypothetical protein